MDSSLRQFLRLISRASYATDPDATLDDAGVDQWECPTSPVDGVERGGIVDPRSGAQLTTTLFPASFAAPQDYPEGWPFLAGLEAAFGSVVDGTEALSYVVWPEPGSLEAAGERITEQLENVGWRRQFLSKPAETVGTWKRQLLECYQKENTCRLLAAVEHEGPPVLFLLQGTEDQLSAVGLDGKS